MTHPIEVLAPPSRVTLTLTATANLSAARATRRGADVGGQSAIVTYSVASKGSAAKS